MHCRYSEGIGFGYTENRSTQPSIDRAIYAAPKTHRSSADRNLKTDRHNVHLLAVQLALNVIAEAHVTRTQPTPLSMRMEQIRPKSESSKCVSKEKT